VQFQFNKKWVLTNYLEQGFEKQPVIKQYNNGFLLYIDEQRRYYKEIRNARQAVAYLKKTEQRNIWEEAR
jgi:hypothetical protein